VEQAQRVAAIVFGLRRGSNFEGNYVVLGDLNDYPSSDTSLGSLLTHEGLVNVVNRLPETERWTHYFAGGDEYNQLDYLLLSASLASQNLSSPGIMRMGLPHRAERYSGQRFPNVGEDNPKASDHAPLFMDIELA
jgi:predicted extracellular nuclease